MTIPEANPPKKADNKAIPPEGLSAQDIQERVDECAMALNDLFTSSDVATKYGPFLCGLALTTLASQINGLNMVIQHYREHNTLPTPEECQAWYGDIFVVHSLRGYQSGVFQQAGMILEKMPEEDRDREAGRVGVIVEQRAPNSKKQERPSGIYVPPSAR